MHAYCNTLYISYITSVFNIIKKNFTNAYSCQSVNYEMHTYIMYIFAIYYG